MILLDTNLLTRMTRSHDPQSGVARAAIQILRGRGELPVTNDGVNRSRDVPYGERHQFPYGERHQFPQFPLDDYLCSVDLFLPALSAVAIAFSAARHRRSSAARSAASVTGTSSNS